MKTGEIWIVNCEPSIGQEIKKNRPAVIVNSDDVASLDIRIIVPFTDATKPARKWHVKVKPTKTNNLKKESLVDCLQLRSFSKERFVKRIGRLSDADLDEVKLCLSKVLDLI